MDTWLLAFFQYLADLCRAFGHAAVMVYNNMLKESLQPPSIGWAIFWATLVLFLLFSGCWAMSIAIVRRHEHAWLFLLLGIFVPIISPIYLLFNLPIYGDEEMKLQLRRQTIAKKAEQAEAERQERERLLAENPNNAIFLQWNKDVMNKMAKKPDGKPAGPWIVTFNDEKMRVERIIEAFDEFVQVEVSGSRDGAKVDIRMPYLKISAWEDVK